MRGIIIVLFLMIVNLNIDAQTYLKDSSVWTINWINIESTPYVKTRSLYKLNGETTILGKVYKKYSSGGSYFTPVREEGDKIYAGSIDYPEFGFQETLLYDFSAKVGDSLRRVDVIGAVSYSVVNKVDTVTLENGEKRKRFFLVDDEYIEGIGSIYGFTNLINAHAGMNVPHLVCYKQNNTILYTNPEYCFGDCCSYNTPDGVKEIKSELNVNIIYKQSIKSLEVKSNILSEVIKSVRIVDICGRMVLDLNNCFTTQLKLNLDTLSKGNYVISVICGETVYVKKIVL